MKRTSTRDAARRRPAREWRRLVAEQRVSREPEVQFCRSRRLELKTFQWWQWSLTSPKGRHARRARGRPETPAADVKVADVGNTAPVVPAFVEVTPREGWPTVEAITSRCAGIEVLIAGVHGEHRVRVDRGFDAATLKRVVAALGRE